MSRTKIKKEIELLINEIGGQFGNPMNNTEIQDLENKLGVKLPQEYKEFLQVFGYLDFFGTQILGSKKGNVEYTALNITLDQRKYYEDKFPHNLVVIKEDGFGNCYCLVCRGKDFGKVIFWQHDAPEDEVYPGYPKNKPNFWVEGTDFLTWLLEKLLIIIEHDLKKKENMVDTR